MKNNKGFTLLEILIVIAIMGLLASVVVVNSSRGMEQSRDSRRIQEVYQIANALMLYYTSYDEFPENTDNDCVIYGIPWDVGNKVSQPSDDTFINTLITGGVLSFLPVEWTSTQDPSGNQYTYRYTKVDDPCEGRCVGTYAILYATCESDICPTGERPVCCDGSSWTDGTGANDASDMFIFLKQRD